MRTQRSKQTLAALAELVLHRVPLTLAAILLMGAIAINFTNVVARYLLHASIYWADEAMVFLAIWSIFLAAVAVMYDGRHLTMDLFATGLPARWRRVLDGAIAAVCLATFAFMAWQGAGVVATLLRNDQRSIALDIPMAIPQAALPLGFAWAALAVVVRAGRRRHPVEPTSDDEITPAA